MPTLTPPDVAMRQDFESGLGLANGFMQNYWRSQENKVNEERYRAGQTLRDVNLSVAQSQLQTIQNAATLKAQQDAAIPGLFGLAVEAQHRGFDTESKSKLWGFAAKNPWVAKTPEFKSLLDQFGESEKAQAARDDLDMRLQNAREVARIREENPGALGEVATRIIEGPNGEKISVFWTGSSWQRIADKKIDPSSTATPILDENGKPLPGVYNLDGRVLKPQANVFSVFGGGGAGATGPATNATVQGSAPTVLKFDKSGKRIN